MALSLERRYAKLVRSYERLKELYDGALQQRKLLADDVKDLQAEVRQLRKQIREHDRAAKTTTKNLFATVRYAIVKLNESGDFASADRLEEWLEVMQDSAVPVARIEHVLDLLQDWNDAMPMTDEARVAALYMRTTKVLHDLRGTEGND